MTPYQGSVARRVAPAPRALRVPHVVAIVLNWCGEEDTAACLESLDRSDYPGLEVLLVDNGSPDGSGDRLRARFPDVPYYQTGKNLGYTGGNNRGIDLALARGADYVLILNNDTVVEPECVSRLVEAAETSPGVGAVAPKILVHDAPERIWFAGGEFSRMRAIGYHRLEGQPDPDPAGGEMEDVSFLTGCCLLVPAGVFRAVGKFEEDFFAYVEDVEYSLRLASAGYRLVYQPGARLLHRVPVGPSDPSAFQIVQRDRNRRRLARRRYGPVDRFRFSLFFYPSRIVRAVQYLARGNTALARAIWRGMTLP